MDKVTAEYHYRVLEIQPGATPQEIKRAYLDMAQVWHPDRFANSPHLQQKAQNKMKEINAAYEFLKNYKYQPPTASTDTGARPRTSYRSYGEATSRPNPYAYSHPLSDEVWKYRGHTGLVSSVAFAPDSQTVVSGSYDKTVRLWGVRSGLEKRWMLGHEGAVMGVAFAPDGRAVLSGSVDKSLRLWEAETRRELQFFGADCVVRCVALAPNGNLALSGSVEGRVQLWDVATGRELKRFSFGGFINSVAFSPEGQRIVAANADGDVALFDVRTGRQLLSVRVERGGKGQMVETVAFAFGGDSVLAASPNSLLLWTAATGRELRRIDVGVSGINAACFTPGAADVLTGHTDGSLRLWNLMTQRESHVFRGHEAEVKSVAVSPNGQFAASGSADKSVRLWRLRQEA